MKRLLDEDRDLEEALGLPGESDSVRGLRGQPDGKGVWGWGVVGYGTEIAVSGREPP